MPTYVHGTVIPEMSDRMYRRRDWESIGMLVRFHGSFEYGSRGCVSKVGMALMYLQYVVSDSCSATYVPCVIE